MTKYDDYLSKRREVLGAHLSTEAIDRRFIPYWEVGARLMVRTREGDDVIGRVQFWGGPEERFLLMIDGAVGSTIQLRADVEILGVAWDGETWVPLVDDMPDPATATSFYLGDEASPMSPRSPDG